MSLIDWCERGLIPDALTRIGIRRLCAERLRDELAGGLDGEDARYRERLADLKQSPLAIHTDAANAQHYELPPGFFERCLGARLKYSSCYYATGSESLDQAEEAMLTLYGERAELCDGIDILELGCGWGSLTLWMAERYPNARITAISNSRPQREFMMARAAQRGLNNVRVLTEDVNRFDIADRFDRVVSIEMFEHLRNYELLFQRIAGWLKPGGKLFVHIFCHARVLYPFETDGANDWMGKYFFTGGQMPSFDTLLHFQRDLSIEETWRVSGRHYQQTSEHWLQNTDRHRAAILDVFGGTYGAAHAARWLQRWRMFYLACAELFGYADGNEWLVGHYRFARRS
jgi:cyclopropane-fatty-acyl-phospholipid synthase